MIQIGISSCLLGNKVRFDGGHKRLNIVTNLWSEFFAYTPYCPEMGMGMPSPRPAIHLVYDKDEQVFLVDSKNHELNYTDAMSAYSQKTCDQMPDFCGFILASRSPSCGMERIKVYPLSRQGAQKKNGVGLFASTLMQNFPLLPVEEDGRLMDLRLRENFLIRVFAYHDFMEMKKSGLSAHKIVQFHSRYKLLLMAHYIKGYQEMGNLVSNLKHQDMENFSQIYLSLLMNSLKKLTTRRKHTNVLSHIQGYFKKVLTASEKQEMVDLIHRYMNGYLPVQAPLALLKHFLKRYPDEYLSAQVYFSPFPEKMLGDS